MTILVLAVAVPAVAHDGGHVGIERSCPLPIPPAGFSDTDANPHEEAIDCLAAWEVTSGAGEGTYAPAGRVTRAQMASFLLRLVEYVDGERPEAGRDYFDDVDPANPHARAINILAEAGVVSGTSETTYSPARWVHRDQMATFIVRTLAHLGIDLPDRETRFDDTEGNPHEPSIRKVVHADISAGTSRSTYSPTKPVSRGQMASFLMRTADVLVSSGHAEPPYAYDPGPAPDTHGDPCSTELALEMAFGVDITYTEAHTQQEDGFSIDSCSFRTDGYYPSFDVTIDGWVPAPRADEIAAMYSARDIFLGDAGIGQSAAVQSSDSNVTRLYVDLGETSFEIALDGVDLTAEEQSDRLLGLAHELIPKLWPDHDFSR